MNWNSAIFIGIASSPSYIDTISPRLSESTGATPMTSCHKWAIIDRFVFETRLYEIVSIYGAMTFFIVYPPRFRTNHKRRHGFHTSYVRPANPMCHFQMFRDAYRDDRMIRMYRNPHIPITPHMIVRWYFRDRSFDDRVCKQSCLVIRNCHMANGKNRLYGIRRVLAGGS